MTLNTFLNDEGLIQSTDVCQQSDGKTNFCKELHKYATADNRKGLFCINEADQERITRGRADAFTIHQAKQSSDLYIKLVWRAIAKRIEATDFSASTCSFSEAPAESVFSVYARVLEVNNV